MAVLRTNLFQQAVIVSDAGSFAFLCRIVVLHLRVVPFVVRFALHVPVCVVKELDQPVNLVPGLLAEPPYRLK